MKFNKIPPALYLPAIFILPFSFVLPIFSQQNQNMSIHVLAQNGDAAAVRQLLRQGVDPNEPDQEEGLTPLMYAARSPEAGTDLLRLLIRYGADVNALDIPPPPPDLSWMDNLPEEVKEQMPKISKEALTPQAKPVLHYAMEGADPKKIKYLIGAGADINYQYGGGYDVLIDAVYKLYQLGNDERNELIRWLLDQGVSVNGLTKYEESALSVASRLGYFDLVALLLEAGANPDEIQWTPLMHATVFGDLAEVRSLLKNWPYSDEQERFGRTAFLLAVQAGRAEIVQALLAAGAMPDEPDRNGKTALMYAAAADHSELLRRLIDQGASLDAVDKSFGYTALMYACTAGAVESARVLLETGADLQVISDFQETAAGLTNIPELFRLLAEHGASWSEANTELKRKLAGLPDDYPLKLSQKAYRTGKERRFGKRNPEKLNIPFWDEMIKNGGSAGAARNHYNDPGIVRLPGRPAPAGPVWCYDRFGKSFTLLPDGRIIEIGGEHEDFYDPDFCIYNDVIVFDGKGDFSIYGYPKEIFPPTDFHTATLVGEDIYIIGGLGYQGERQYGQTSVYRLNTHSFAIEPVATTGAMPGWIFKHQAVLAGNGKIVISGGQICRQAGQTEELVDNPDTFVLDVRKLHWE